MITLENWRERMGADMAIEHEEQSHLGGDGYGGLAGVLDQSGLRGDVIVPEVVMHHLEAPLEFPGAGL